MKTLHELGHAYAVKRWGGEVHEIGLMFLVFIPVPYVDASDATSFRRELARARSWAPPASWWSCSSPRSR